MINIAIDANSFLRKLSWYLWLVCCALVLCDFVFTYLDVTGYYVFRRSFDMTREETIPNWYATILLFCIALTCALIFVTKRAQEERDGNATPWLLFAGFFTFLSVDDGSRIHERLGSFFKDLTEEGAGIFWVFQDLLESASTWGWQVFVLPIFLFMGFFMLLWGYQHVRNTETQKWVLLGALCIAMAIALDYVEGLIEYEVVSLEDRWLSEEMLHHYQRVVEEFLEMTGFIMVIRGLWTYLLNQAETLEVNILS